MRILFLLLLPVLSFCQPRALAHIASRGSAPLDVVSEYQSRVEADGGTFVSDCIDSQVTDLRNLNFFDQALFLLTPNGYKTSKLYAIKPSDGTGDLTFSRSSIGSTLDGTSLSSNVPRIDDCNLLLEPSKTNLLLRSETFDNATWTKTNATVSANASVAPDGTTTADKIVESTATGAHGVSQNVSKATSQLPYVAQFYVKEAGTTWARISCFQSTNAIVTYYNLSAGVVGSVEIADNATRFSLIDYGIKNVGNGWYLCWVAFTSSDQNNVNPFIGPTTGDLVETHTGNTSNGIYVWGGKLIQSETPRPDSYVATTTASSTRDADVISSLTSVSSLIGQTEGTLYLNLESSSDATAKTFAISDGTADNRITVTLADEVTVTAVTSGVTQASISNDWFGSNTEYRIAITYQSNKVALFVNGVKIGQDLSVTVPACSQFDFSIYGQIFAIGNSSVAMSDAEAQALTFLPAPDDFTDFISRYPPTKDLSPVLAQSSPYINTCPAGIITDPTDTTKILFYRGEFLGPSTEGARITLFTAPKSDPTDFTSVGVIFSGSISTDINGCRFGWPMMHNDSVYYYYVGIDASLDWRIHLATSADGRTFTKKGVVLDFSGDEASVSGPSVIIEDGIWYMIYSGWDGIAGTDDNPGDSKLGIRLATSTDGRNWTKTGTTVIPRGNANKSDGENVEDGILLKLGDYYVIVYSSDRLANKWTINVAYSTALNQQFTKRGVYVEQGNLVACPAFFRGHGFYMVYYQHPTTVAHNDIYISNLIRQ